MKWPYLIAAGIIGGLSCMVAGLSLVSTAITIAVADVLWLLAISRLS